MQCQCYVFIHKAKSICQAHKQQSKTNKQKTIKQMNAFGLCSSKKIFLSRKYDAQTLIDS